MSRNDQIIRQWSLLRRFEAAPAGLGFADVQELYNSERTFYRDREALEAAGFPLAPLPDDPARRWGLLRTFARQGGVPLTMSEVFALRWARRALSGPRGGLFAEALDSLAQKLDATLSPRLLGFARALDEVVVASPLSGGQLSAEQRRTVDALTQACAERRTVALAYRAGSGALSRRRVDPYNLWARDTGVYLYAWCHARQAIRTFRLDRIQDLEVTAEPFTPKPGADLASYTETRFRMLGDGSPEHVVIRFAPELAHYIGERTWHPSQSLETEPAGSVLLHLHVDGLQELAAWILSFGPQAQALAPPRLVDHLKTQLEKTRAHYTTPTPDPDQKSDP